MIPLGTLGSSYMAATAPSFSPALVGGKVLWLRGKDLGAGGSAVTTWLDQSGTSHHATSAHDNPTVAAASTPSGGKSLALNHSRLDLPSLGLTGAGEMWMVIRNTNATSADANATAWKFGADFGAAVNNYYGYTKFTVSDDFGTSTRRDFSTTTFSASSNYPDHVPANAFDGASTGLPWTTNGTSTGWIQVKGKAVAVTSYAIHREDGAPNRSPKDFTFKGSNDGSTWTTLDTRTGITWPTPGETKTFTFTNTTAYGYYRLDVTANNGDTYLGIPELTLSPSPLLDTNAWRLYRVSITDGGAGTGTWKAELDGATLATIAGAAIQWTSAPRLSGDAANFSGRGIVGNMAEVLIRNTVSTPSEVSNFVGYFNTEHGLTVPV